MLPDKIEKCPIIDTVVEIRFRTDIFSNAIFGIIYNEFKADYPIIEKLPILQIPEQLRDIDPNFKFKPHYKISNDLLTIQIGPEVIAIGSKIPYVGWTDYSKNIYQFLKQLFDKKIITEVLRLGVRYVNFFERIDIFPELNFGLKIIGNEHNCKNTIIRTELDRGEWSNSIQVANNVSQNEGIIGSILDIDTFKVYSGDKFVSNYKKEIENAHKIEKSLFFELLSDNFLQSLKPIYNESNKK